MATAQCQAGLLLAQWGTVYGHSPLSVLELYLLELYPSRRTSIWMSYWRQLCAWKADRRFPDKSLAIIRCTL